MRIELETRLNVLRRLRDADAEALHDLDDGFEPEPLDEQWQRAVEDLANPMIAELTLIALVNAGWVVGRPVHALPGPGLRAGDFLEYGGLTDLGRRTAAEHGWVDSDPARAHSRV